MAASMGYGLKRAAVCGVGALVGLLWMMSCAPSAPQPVKPASQATDVTDQLGANTACYVCHMTFVREEISKRHLAAKVGCINCHGLSAGHANDENIGATKPDIRYKRADVDAMCSKCHKRHDVPPAQVVQRFVSRKLPAERQAVCTDCHGSHHVKRAAATQGSH